MYRFAFVLINLGTCWLLLSGHYTPLLLSFGIVSCFLVWILSWRMNLVGRERQIIPLNPVGFVSYFIWLCIEVVKSNLDVAYRILSPDLPIQPRLLKIKTSQVTELGQVIFANSITLTPGTVSIDLRGDEIEVHALAQEPAGSLLSGEMNRRITAMERSQPGNPKGSQ